MKDSKFDFDFAFKFCLLFGALFLIFGYLLVKTNSIMLENILEKYSKKTNGYFYFGAGGRNFRGSNGSGYTVEITQETKEVNGKQVQRSCYVPVRKCKSL